MLTCLLSRLAQSRIEPSWTRLREELERVTLSEIRMTQVTVCRA